MIATILLVPAEGSGLLDDPCAPVAFLHRGAWCLDGPGLDGQATHALVLATDGKVQRHGALASSTSTPMLYVAALVVLS